MKSKIFLVISIIFFFGTIHVYPESKIESLEYKVRISSGKDRLESLYKLSDAYLLISVDKSIQYSKEGLELAINLGEIHYEEMLLKNLGSAYVDLGNFPLAIDYYSKGLKIAEKLGEKVEQSFFYNEIGILYKNLGNDIKALEYYNKALNLRNELGDRVGTASTLNNIGNIYLNRTEYEKALDYYYKSLRIKEQIGDKKGISSSLNNIGLVYGYMKNYEKSLEFHLNSLKMKEALDDKRGVASTLNNLGNVYFAMNDYGKAISYHLKSIKLKEQLNDKKGIAAALNNIGNCYDGMGDYKNALIYYEKSLKQYETEENLKGIGTAILNIGNIYIKLQNYEKASEYLNRSLSFARENRFRDIIAGNYYSFAILHSNLGNNKLSDEYIKMYQSLKDSMFNEENTKKIAEYQVLYETDKKMKENELLKKENEKKLIELNEHERIKTLWFIISGLILTSSFVFYKMYSNKKKATELLGVKNRELEIANLKLKESENRLKEVNMTKQKFFYIIAHDLKNSLSTMMTSSDFISYYTDKFDIDKVKKNVNKLKISSRNLIELLDNLLHWSLSETDKLDFIPENLNCYNLIEKIILQLKSHSDIKSITIYNSVNPGQSIYADANLLSIVFRNLISNAVKFTNIGGLVKISLIENSDEYVFFVEDNGVGIKPEDMNKLFRQDTHVTTLGTFEEKGTGLGLMICKEFIEKHGGKISVESVPDFGTKFRFTIPKNNIQTFS